MRLGLTVFATEAAVEARGVNLIQGVSCGAVPQLALVLCARRVVYIHVML